MTNIRGTLAFWPPHAGDIISHPPRDYDMRLDPDGYAPDGLNQCEVEISDARSDSSLKIETVGFQLFEQASKVADFYDTALVVDTYYPECKALAKEITGAHHVFTYDHLIREPGRQISGGGKDGSVNITTAEAGGGYVGAVHMDYTERTTWQDYLQVHGQKIPESSQIISLNFWRPLVEVIHDQPLAICDASSVQPHDLFETVVTGYGADSYSWHDIGIETYNVKYSPAHRWFYYSAMRNHEVLVFKSYDSRGVIGRACPHASFSVSNQAAPPRRSIELRVLCFI